MHAAVLLDIVGALRVFAHRAVMESTRDAMFGPHDVPLAILILTSVGLAEFTGGRITPQKTIQIFVLALVFFVSTFPLLSENRFKDYAAATAYLAVMVQLSVVLLAAVTEHSDFEGVAVLSMTLFIAFTLAGFVYTFSSDGGSRPTSVADAAVVLGASVWGRETPSPLLKGRLDGAIRLFNEGRARRIVVTGGTRRFGTVESAVEAAYLREGGIPDSVVLKEAGSLSTSDQARYIKNVLVDSLGLSGVTIVTDRWHLPRVLLMCRWNGTAVAGEPSDYRMPPLVEMYYRLRESAALQIFLLFGV